MSFVQLLHLSFVQLLSVATVRTIRLVVKADRWTDSENPSTDSEDSSTDSEDSSTNSSKSVDGFPVPSNHENGTGQCH